MPDPAHVNEQIAAIKDRIPDYWRDDASQADAAEVWGGGANSLGVLVPAPLEIIAEHKRTQAGVRIAASPNGLFAYGLEFSGPECGFGFFPSIWHEAYASREEAMHAALTELLERLGERWPGGKEATQQVQKVRQQIQARLHPRQMDLFSQRLTDASEQANFPPAQQTRMSPMSDETLAIQTAQEAPATKPKKPRAPRKRKPKEPPAETQSLPLPEARVPVIPETAPAADSQDQADTAEERAAMQAEAPAGQVTATEISGKVLPRLDEQGELVGAKPRKSGRKAWDINLGQGEHVWERVTTPENEMVFRFKNEPTEAQMDLIQRFGFHYDAEHKEAYRPNDEAGRISADKLAWYLKDLGRVQGAGQVAAL